MMTGRGWKVAAIVSLTLPCGASLFAQAPGERGPSNGRTLFDGRTLDGWEHVGPGRFVVEDGQLRTEGGMGLLWYAREKLGNCIIRVVYKTGTERSNSGVYIRIAEKPGGGMHRAATSYRRAALVLRSTLREPRRMLSRRIGIGVTSTFLAALGAGCGAPAPPAAPAGETFEQRCARLAATPHAIEQPVKPVGAGRRYGATGPYID